MGIFLHIEPSVSRFFHEQGLDSFDAIMDKAVGELINSDDSRGKDVRRLNMGGEECFYLKRVKREPLNLLLGMALSAHRLYSGPLREQRLLTCLKKAGFAVMESVAWGEKRICGIPVRGFLVLREVKGREVSALFDTLDTIEKCKLMETVGLLVGQLHAKGFFHPVRLKDLIRTEDSIVLIDRETSKPWPTFFMRRKCTNSLTRAVLRTIRDGHKLTAGSAIAFLRGYTCSLNGRWNISIFKLAHIIISNLRLEIPRLIAKGRLH